MLNRLQHKDHGNYRKSANNNFLAHVLYAIGSFLGFHFSLLSAKKKFGSGPWVRNTHLLGGEGIRGQFCACSPPKRAKEYVPIHNACQRENGACPLARQSAGTLKTHQIGLFTPPAPPSTTTVGISGRTRLSRFGRMSTQRTILRFGDGENTSASSWSLGLGQDFSQ